MLQGSGEQGQPGTHEVRAAFFSHLVLDVERQRARTPGRCSAEKHQPVPPSHPGSRPGMSRAPSRCLSALCPLFLSSSTSHHPARNIPTRHSRMSPFASPAASQGKQAGLGSLAPAAGGAQLSCAAQPTPHIPDPHLAGSHSRAGGEGGGVGKKRQVGCVEASAKELCGEQNRQKSAPQFHPCHPLRSFTASPLPELHRGGDTDPKGPPHPCCHPQPALGEGSEATATSLAAGCPSFVLGEQSQAREAG